MDRATVCSSSSCTLHSSEGHDSLGLCCECHSLEFCKTVALRMWAETSCRVIRESSPIMEDDSSKDVKAVREQARQYLEDVLFNQGE